MSERSSLYENKVLFTKPFQASSSWHQLKDLVSINWKNTFWSLFQFIKPCWNHRCKKLSALNLDHTQITNGALNSLIEESKDTLEELSVAFCYFVAICSDLDPLNIQELGSMPELRVLNCNFGDVETLRERVPRLIINRSEIRIAKFWISDPCLSNGKSVTN